MPSLPKEMDANSSKAEEEEEEVQVLEYREVYKEAGREIQNHEETVSGKDILCLYKPCPEID